MIKLTPVFAAVLMLMGLSAPAVPPAEAQAGDNRHAEVSALLSQRQSALARGDRTAFLSTVDENSSPGFKQRQAAYFDGWQRVPVRDLRLTARIQESGDLSAGIPTGSYGSAPLYLPETRQTYRLADYDSIDAVEALWLTYVKRGEQWKVVADDDLAPIGLVTAINLWDLEPVVTRTTPHFMLIGAAHEQARLDDFAGLAEEAHRRFRATWTQPWSGRIPIIVPSSREQAQRLIGDAANIGNLVAFVVFSPVRTPDYAVSAPRMYAGLVGNDQRSRASRVDDLVHELVHAATAADTGPFTPVWLQEGWAEYIRLQRPSPNIPTGPLLQALPAGGAFSASNPVELRKAYDTSLVAVARLAAREGPSAPGRYLAALKARSASPGSPAYNADVAARDTFGYGTAGLERN